MTPNNQHIKVFIAYAREDAKYLDKLRKYLRPLERNSTIEIWCDTEINPGKEWDISIQNNLQNAEIILVLVSSNLFDSDYFYEVELPKALERHHNGEAIIIPVILSACTWDFTELKDLQALPEGGKPIRSWQDKAEAYTNVVRGIDKNIQQIKQKRIEAKKQKEAELKAEKERQAEQRKMQEDFDTYLIKLQEQKAKREKLPESLQELIKDMIYVEGDEFEMGSSNGLSREAPVHKVKVGSFSICKYPITWEQWNEIMGKKRNQRRCYGKYPVERVSWYECQDFIKKLNQITGESFRLPTEAEWEFAAKGGKKSKNYEYSGSNDIKKVAWYRGRRRRNTSTVGQLAPNELGIFDMSGGVWEWCSDWFELDYCENSPINNPKGSNSSREKSIRGGSWREIASNNRISTRDYYSPSKSSDDIGFRLVKGSIEKVDLKNIVLFKSHRTKRKPRIELLKK